MGEVRQRVKNYGKKPSGSFQKQRKYIKDPLKFHYRQHMIGQLPEIQVLLSYYLMQMKSLRILGSP